MGYVVTNDDLSRLREDLDAMKYSAQTKDQYYKSILRFHDYSPEVNNTAFERYLKRKTSSINRAALKFYHTWIRSNTSCTRDDLDYEFKKVYSGVRREPVTVSRDAVYEIISMMPDEKHKMFTEFLFLTALRISEALRVKWQDFMWFEWLQDMDEPLVLNLPRSKKGKNQTTDLSPLFARKLYESNIHMCDSRGMPYNERHLVFDFGLENYKDLDDYTDHMRHNYKHLLKKVSREAIGRPISPHKTRHSYAQYMLDSGAPIEVVSRKLRHADLKTTQIYAKTSLKRVSDFTKKLD